MLADALKKPISWTNGGPDVQAFLSKLQGNILKGHGRNHTVNLFCRFRDDATSRARARAFMAEQVARMKSARQQLDATAEKNASGKLDTDPFVCLFLTKAGFDYFGVPPAKQPTGKAFQAGMHATAGLNDPPPANWSAPLRDPHVLLLVGLMDADAAEREATRLLNQIGEIGDVRDHMSGDVIGGQYFNDEGNGVENFGYVDGRSQPLVLEEDIAREAAEVAADPGKVGTKNAWPASPFPVDQFVVPDPVVADAAAYGSYFVFRQLEQNVAGFKGAEDQVVADRPDESLGGNADSLGVGRQENGTPMERSATARIEDGAGKLLPVSNAFLFSSDPPRCPFFAHIRKVNPRTPDTQKHLMIRRGITYGFRSDRTVDKQGRFVLPDNAKRPRKDVGLLFQSYQASIEDQFEVAQVFWANSPRRPDAPSETVGIDVVIGQPGPGTIEWPKAYETLGTPADTLDFYKLRAADTGPYVRLVGGGYFFAPSLPGLQAIFGGS